MHPAKQVAHHLPDAWIERLFQRFEDFYGAKWAAQYGAFPRARVMRTWAEELAGFHDKRDCLAEAIKVQLGSPFPPTLPEFLKTCREIAQRHGDAKPLALDHKLSPEEMERNRQRLAAISEQLGRKMAAASQGND